MMESVIWHWLDAMPTPHRDHEKARALEVLRTLTDRIERDELILDRSMIVMQRNHDQHVVIVRCRP